MRGGNTRTYPSFPDIEKTIGYNPARFLQTRSPDGHNSPGDTSDLATAKALIHGIDDIATIEAWREVEHALGRNGGDPRENVCEWLEERETALTPTTNEEEPAPESAETTERAPATNERATVAAETDEADECTTTSPPAAEPTTTSPVEQTAVATDGGSTALTDPTCSNCYDELDREEICEQIGFWCPTCRDFQEPVEGAA